ncbi:MAG: DUF460 domain-containing protein [Candidatus Marsarchaeota archaeon]|nr:DUF460 domain-containing protein [Candidatus Marsarchaeota archaeon]
MDLHGVVVDAGHKASSGVEWLIEEISKSGIPSVITSDRAPNDIVKKVCSSFNARLYTSRRVLTIDEKSELARPIGIKNPHERDAYSAAIKAFNIYSSKLKQAERIAKENSLGEDKIDEIKAKVINKYSIDEALVNKPANRK